jgi:hypothetical protein
MHRREGFFCLVLCVAEVVEVEVVVACLQSKSMIFIASAVLCVKYWIHPKIKELPEVGQHNYRLIIFVCNGLTWHQ